MKLEAVAPPEREYLVVAQSVLTSPSTSQQSWISKEECDKICPQHPQKSVAEFTVGVGNSYSGATVLCGDGSCVKSVIPGLFAKRPQMTTAGRGLPVLSKWDEFVHVTAE